MGLLAPSRITTMEDAKKHRAYALGILFIVYIFNFIDRQIINMLQEPMKAELGLSDTQLGLLSGLTFAAIYCTMGIPVARIADATSRKAVVATSLGVWSAFTMACGLAGGFWTLFLARLGVGLGQAGASPPAHAILSDLYEKEKRGRALAIYSAGLYAGTLMAYWMGGWISDALGWREAFFLVGLPGVAFAFVVWFTLREPVRGLSGLKPSTANITFMESFRKLWALKSFRFYSIATGAGTFVTYGLGNWMPSFMQRTHAQWAWPEFQAFMGQCGFDELAAGCAEISRTEIGLFFGLAAGIGGAIGTIGGGILADKLGANDRRWFLWVPMWGKLLCGPAFLFCVLAPAPELSLLGYFVGIMFAAAYLGPSLAITHHLVPASMRAMSSAVLFFILNMIGLGFGPMTVGIISDWLQANTTIQEMSARWAMATIVVVTYPLTILWYWGANALPKGELDSDGAPAADAVLTRSMAEAEEKKS